LVIEPKPVRIFFLLYILHSGVGFLKISYLLKGTRDSCGWDTTYYNAKIENSFIVDIKRKAIISAEVRTLYFFET